MATLQVVIVGADVTTLTLALLLEQAGVDYLLLESTDSVPAVAGGMTLHPTVLPLLEQLSLRDDLFFFSQPMEQVLILDSDMEYVSSYDWSDRQTRFGAWSRFISRPEYCAMILEKLPESKVLFNKIVTSVSTIENDDDSDDVDDDDCTPTDEDSDIQDEKRAAARGVTVECADGTVYSGHILIGDIDSDVERKLLYNSSIHSIQRESPERSGAAGSRDMPAREAHYHVSGITEALDPQRIPLLKEDKTELRLVLDSRNSLSWWAATLADNRIAWQISKRVPLCEKSSRSIDVESFRNEQAASATILGQISPNMMCPLGGTMAQLLDWTPQSQISCRRWDDRRNSVHAHSSRVLLLGEACRKMVPVLGQPAEETILDALALSEVLFALPSTRLIDIRQAFDRYLKERTSRRESAITESRELDLTLNAKGPIRKLYRTAMLNYMPKYINERKGDEKYAYRPQANFLDLVPDYGHIQPTSSSYTRRYSSEGGEKY